MEALVSLENSPYPIDFKLYREEQVDERGVDGAAAVEGISSLEAATSIGRSIQDLNIQVGKKEFTTATTTRRAK